MHDIPICFNCTTQVRASDAVFEAPCGHDSCPSVVFHGLCLMEWRDNREVVAKRMRVVVIDFGEFFTDEPEDDL